MKNTILDFKIRNVGNKVAFIHKAIFNVKKIWQLKPFSEPLGPVKVSYNYDIRLYLDRYPYTFEKSISQEVNANNVDRFTFTLGNDTLSYQLQYRDLIFEMKIVLVYNEDNRKIETTNLLFSPGTGSIDSSYFLSKYVLPNGISSSSKYAKVILSNNEKVFSDISYIKAKRNSRVNELINYYKKSLLSGLERIRIR